MPVFGNESNNIRALENSGSDRMATSERAEQLALAAAFDTCDPDDLACTNGEARLAHAYGASPINQRDVVGTEDWTPRSIVFPPSIGW